jgi:circadian clock protein KaiC
MKRSKKQNAVKPLEKLETGVPGFDLVCKGGLPKSRITLLAGTTGSAKTVFACQFLAEGIRKAGENGVFVTFEESPEDIRKNMVSLGWNIAEWEAQGQWVFVDASPQMRDSETEVEAGEYDLGALLARIEHAIRTAAAKRLSMDSLGAILNRFSDTRAVRGELFRIASTLKHIGVTTLMTAERVHEYGEIARYGVEEFITDNVILVRNVLEEERRRRTVEVVKFRGADHEKGERPFTIIPGEGIVVIPPSAFEPQQKSSVVRTTSGNKVLDRMCGGGFFRDSIILVSGATGTGKTLMTTEFIAGGLKKGERCLLFAFEESREQLFRNAIGWGIDYKKMETQGKVKVICTYPETASLEDHLIQIKKIVDEFRPSRLAIDSLSAMERVSTLKNFREFVLGLTSFIKHKGITGLFTATTSTLTGGPSLTETHISTITDSIILLRYMELYGEMRRGVTVLKMRCSKHAKGIYEFTVDGQGMHINSSPFRHVSGIVAGNVVRIPPDEVDRANQLFRETSFRHL